MKLAILQQISLPALISCYCLVYIQVNLESGYCYTKPAKHPQDSILVYIAVLFFVRILDKRKLFQQTELKDTIFRWLEDGIDSPYLLGFIIDIYEEQLEDGEAPEGTLSKAKDVSS